MDDDFPDYGMSMHRSVNTLICMFYRDGTCVLMSALYMYDVVDSIMPRSLPYSLSYKYIIYGSLKLNSGKTSIYLFIYLFHRHYIRSRRNNGLKKSTGNRDRSTRLIDGKRGRISNYFNNVENRCACA